MRIEVPLRASGPSSYKAARAGKLMLWTLGPRPRRADGKSALARLYGRRPAARHLARFRNAEFDRIYQRMQLIADRPRARRALPPGQAHRHSLHALQGHRAPLQQRPRAALARWATARPLFWHEWWHMVDIDDSRRPAK
jgi:hypothetical protein